MSKSKKIEKIIDTYKNLLSILIVALFGMVAFLFVNADIMSVFKIVLLVLGIIFDCIIIAIVVWQYVKNLNILELCDDS